MVQTPLVFHGSLSVLHCFLLPFRPEWEYHLSFAVLPRLIDFPFLTASLSLLSSSQTWLAGLLVFKSMQDQLEALRKMWIDKYIKKVFCSRFKLVNWKCIKSIYWQNILSATLLIIDGKTPFDNDIFVLQFPKFDSQLLFFVIYDYTFLTHYNGHFLQLFDILLTKLVFYWIVN